MKKIDRFLKYLDYKGITENKATTECGLSNGLIGQAKRGKCDLGQKATEKILNKYQELSRVWLLTGEGEMLLPESTNNDPPPEKKHTEMEERLIKLLEQAAKEKERLLEIIDRQNKQIADLQSDKTSGGGFLNP